MIQDFNRTRFYPQMNTYQTTTRIPLDEAYTCLCDVLMQVLAPLNEIIDSYVVDFMQRLSKEKWFRQDIKRAAKEMQRAIRENVKSAHSYLRDIPKWQANGRTVDELRRIGEFRSDIYYAYVDIVQEEIRKETERIEQAIRKIMIQYDGKVTEPIAGFLTINALLHASKDAYENTIQQMAKLSNINFFTTFLCYYPAKAQHYADVLSLLYDERVYRPKGEVRLDRQLEYLNAMRKFGQKLCSEEMRQRCMLEAFKKVDADLSDDLKRMVFEGIEEKEQMLKEKTE